MSDKCNHDNVDHYVRDDGKHFNICLKCKKDLTSNNHKFPRLSEREILVRMYTELFNGIDISKLSAQIFKKGRQR